MRLSFSVLQALRGGVVTGGVACVLTVGCGGGTHAESTTPEPVHAQSQTSTPMQPTATVAVSNQNSTTTLAVTPAVTHGTTETHTTSEGSPENTPSPVEPEDYSAMAACGRG